MSKPREFWICDLWDRPNRATRTTLDSDPGHVTNSIMDIFHVIEKSAYNNLQAQCEKLAARLSAVLNSEAIKEAPVRHYSEAWKYAEEALAEYEEFKKND